MPRPEETSLHALQRDLTAGQLGRRDFIRRAAALGLSASAIAGALAACGGAEATPAPAAPAAAATTAPAAPTAAPAGGAATAAPTTAAAPAAPTAAAAPAKRGGGGTVKILLWQAPTVVNIHFSSGTKDDIVTRVVYEPLATLDNDGKFVPLLASTIPSKENGLLAADGKSVTWKLKEGIKWSDGAPFSADDVVFTWQYATDKETAASTVGQFTSIDKVEKVDPLTVKITFKDVTPGWFIPFVGTNGCVIPKHIFEKDKGAAAKQSPNNLKPIGTGPYKMIEFKPGDSAVYTINENYREPNKPFFDRVEVKGGGDAVSAARAVLQTGDYDYAWNLQVEAAVLNQLQQGGKGVIKYENGGGIERNLINFTDPNKEVDGERSSLKAPHPFQTDPKIRQAYSLLSDRDSIVKSIYGQAGEVTSNIISDPPQYRSSNTKVEFSPEKANALLDEAGWRKGSDGIRAKDGVKLQVLYQTSTNSVRQKTQQILKDAFEKAGIKTELKSVDAGIYFSSDAGNPDTTAKFYADIEMYTSYNVLPDPQSYFEGWLTEEIAQKANQWSGNNYTRWSNPEYDRLFEQAKTELDEQKRAQLFIQMNDLVINNYVHIPLVLRKTVFAHTNALKNVNYSIWDVQIWNIANWTK